MSAARFLWQQLYPSRRAALAVVVATIAAIVAQLLVPRLLGSFINGVEARSPGAQLQPLAIGFLAAAAAAPVARYWAALAGAGLLWTVGNQLREHLLAKVLALPGEFHLENPPGELVERLDGDVSALGSMLAGLGVELLANGGLVAGAIVGLLTVNALLGGLLAALAVLALEVMERFRRRAVPLVERERAANAQAFGTFGEVLDARRDLAGVGAEEYGAGRFAQALERWQSRYVRADLMGYAAWAASLTAFGLMDAAAYAVSGRLVLVSHLPLGTAYTLVAYVALMAGPLEQLRSQIEELQRAQGSLQRVMELSRLETDAKTAAEPVSLGALAVRLDGVSRRHDGGRGVHGVTLVIPAGQHVGVVGSSGAGKSTFARLVAGLDAPDDGTIAIAEVTRGCGMHQRTGGRVALLPQDPALFSATVRDNLTLFDPSAADDPLIRALEAVGVSLSGNGLMDFVDPERLSAGEAALLCLARVLVGDPGLVILDEPTARLDPDTARAVGQAVQRALSGRTALVLAHRLETLRNMDRILVFDQGRVVEDGPPALLAENPDTWFCRLLRANGGVFEVQTP